MRRLELVSDCDNCAGLCCELTSFTASDDFAFDKPTGERCRHLTGEARCAIHARREALGFGGCGLYECFGAGPRATRSLQGQPLEVRVEGFRRLRALGELSWLLEGAALLCAEHGRELSCELEHEQQAVSRLSGAPVYDLLACDLSELETRVHGVLRRVGAAMGGRTGRAGWRSS